MNENDLFWCFSTIAKIAAMIVLSRAYKTKGYAFPFWSCILGLTVIGCIGWFLLRQIGDFMATGFFLVVGLLRVASLPTRTDKT